MSFPNHGSSFKASKALYTVVARRWHRAASGAAWWYQNKLSSPAGGFSRLAAAPAPRGAASGPGAQPGAPGVEVAKVE
jgi:membrane fusion protein (multidrug efflux system)